MTSNITDVVRQFKADWTSQLDSAAIIAACHEADHRWRNRTLNPVVSANRASNARAADFRSRI